MKFIKIIIFIICVLISSSCNENKPVESLKRPNILFALGDDISYPFMGAYGTKWIKTPAFDRVAKEGMLFTKAYTPNAKCGPSRAILLTGRNSWQLEEACNHFANFPKKFKTFMEELKDSSYFTGYTAKGFAPGNPGYINGIKRELTGKKYSDIKLKKPTTGISSIDYAANFKKFLEDKPKDKPFCFWFGSNEPHRPYEFGSGVRIGNKSEKSIDSVFKYWPDNDKVRKDLLDYAFEIEHFDSHLDKMLKYLESIGELANTIVIVTADNGMPFPRVKGQAYEQSNHLPLAIMWGNQIKKRGAKISKLVSFTDLTATMLDAANINIKKSGMAPLEGNSLIPLLLSSDPENIETRNFMLIGKERHDVGRPNDVGYPIRGIIMNDYLFIRNYKPNRWPAGNPITGYLNCDAGATKSAILNGRREALKFPQGKEIYNINLKYWDLSFGKRPQEELYNIKKDPECINNLSKSKKYADVKNKLEQIMINELKKEKDPRMFGNGDMFEKFLYSDKKTRDFYNRFLKNELNKQSASWVDSTDFEATDY